MCHCNPCGPANVGVVHTLSRTPVADSGSEALSNGIGITRIERANGVERRFRTARYEEGLAGWFEYELEDLVNTEVRPPWQRVQQPTFPCSPLFSTFKMPK